PLLRHTAQPAPARDRTSLGHLAPNLQDSCPPWAGTPALLGAGGWRLCWAVGQRSTSCEVAGPSCRHVPCSVRQLMPLLKLQHVHISVYRELFILWNSEVSSLFLCLVMEHSKDTLQNVIEKKRAARAALESQVRRALTH
uniref:Uncharacterized protein n=1 Tax=Sus scrofa TaxID=9823 RepID=A0A8D0VQH8_PIG